MQSNSLWNLLVILGLGLGPIACSTSKPDSTGPAHSKHDTYTTLELNNGKKWVVAKPMMVHIRNLEKAVQNFGAEMASPGPSQTFLLMDQREDSINDAAYLNYMDGFSTGQTGLQKISDYPSSYHNGACGLNFCDGHAEVHRWVDNRTTPPLRRDFHLPGVPAIPSPNNTDITWLQQRTTSRK